MLLFGSSSLPLFSPSPPSQNQNQTIIYLFSHTYRERSKKKKKKKKEKKFVSMAVESRHLNIFPSQLIGNREMMNNVNAYNNALIGYGLPPLSGTTTTETLLPMYNNSTMKADSGLTYAIPSVSRKRSRDSTNPLNSSFPSGQIPNQINNRSGSFTFFGEDFSPQIQQQQLEIDRFIAQHTEKVRLEVEERRKRHSRRIMAVVEEGIVKRLRAKEEEMEKIGKLNWALEEKVKSLCIESQIWRELAQTNEATANALRSNLEQVLAHVNDEQQQHDHREGAFDQAAAGDLIDDAQSCCGSNNGGIEEERRRLAICGGERNVVKDKRNDDCGASSSSSSGSERLCRHCGKVESRVLLLPCRHLCLCTVCGSAVHTCPICNTPKNASLHVIMSS